ncbi:uncharacterized protein [Chironomus tepperi]|uniref:uncharacterized protein n=1 Tax=Chironomus tepperi TaxID=113505 RepID=UPI00391F3BEF
MSPLKDHPSILQLPSELLIEIFSYITDHRYITFVCHRFYQIICLMQRNFCILSIKDENTLLRNEIFSSIISSQRIITEIKLRVGLNFSDLFWSRFEAIILKLRHHIRSLDITFTDVPQSIPYNFKLVNILHLLPFECPQMLRISNIDLEYLKRFISSRDIKDLTIIGAIKDQSLFMNLNLRHLTLIAPKCSINEALSTQKNLINLKLVADESTVIDNQTLCIIQNLEQLEDIDIPLIKLDSYKSIETFHSMRNLKTLNFQSNAEFAFEFCNSVMFTALTELDISVPNELLLDDTFDNITFNFPNLKSLGIRTPMALKIFKNLCINSLINFESILIENIFYGFVGITILDLHEYNLIQKKVKKLILINHDRKVIICKNDLLRLLKLFPNLEYLVLSGYFDTQNYLEGLLKSMKKLKEIVIISSVSHSTTHTMGIIKEYGHRLQLIVLENFKSACDVENLKMFFEDQFPVIEKRNSNLVLKKNGNLVLKEFS